MSTSTVNGSEPQTKKRKRKLDCFEILNNCDYGCIESVCISIKHESQQDVDNFMEIHYLRDDDLLSQISDILRDCIVNNCDCESNKPLTAALLLILPFINCSQQIEHDICQKYVSVYDRKENNNLCRGLVFALSWKVSIISLQTKTWIMSSLCRLIEIQHALKISSKIKDAYNGLVRYSLQILQCQFLSQTINTHIKQYAIRILLCELNEGVMARQYLKDQYTNLIVLQCIIMLHEQYENSDAINITSNYDEYQWLMVKLFQFLYQSFDFDDLWMTLDEYKHKTMIDIHHQKQQQKEFEFNDDRKSHYLRNYLMTKCQFGRLLQTKCKLFLNSISNKGILIRVACKLLLEYPLNDKYGLCSHANNKYTTHHSVVNINNYHHHNNHHHNNHHHMHHMMAPFQINVAANNNNHVNQMKNRKNKMTKSKQSKKNKQKSNKSNRSNANKTNKNTKSKNNKKKNNVETIAASINSICSNDEEDDGSNAKHISKMKNNHIASANIKSDQVNDNHDLSSYSGPNWLYEFRRLLRNEMDLNNDNNIDPKLKLKLFYCYN